MSVISSKGQATKQRLLTATAKLLEAQGYHGTGLNQIIAESGAPKGVIYYHFPAGKDELAATAILQQGDVLAANVTKQLAQVDDPATAVRNFAGHIAEHIIRSDCASGAPIATTALEAPQTSERLRLACMQAYDALQQPFYTLLTTAGLQSDAAQALATTIQAALEGGVILVRLHQDPAPLKAIGEQLAKLVKASLETTTAPTSD